MHKKGELCDTSYLVVHHCICITSLIYSLSMNEKGSAESIGNEIQDCKLIDGTQFCLLYLLHSITNIHGSLGFRAQLH